MAHDLDLRTLIVALLAERPGQPLKPHEIAAGLSGNLHGRHVGVAAVINSCLHCADLGRIWLTTESPLTFAYPANGDVSDGSSPDPSQPSGGRPSPLGPGT